LPSVCIVADPGNKQRAETKTTEVPGDIKWGTAAALEAIIETIDEYFTEDDELL
jgi:hypothetical protein